MKLFFTVCVVISSDPIGFKNSLEGSRKKNTERIVFYSESKNATNKQISSNLNIEQLLFEFNCPVQISFS